MKKISSILFVLLLMLASFTAGTQYPRGDLDYNGKVNIADVVALTDYLLSGTWENEPVTPPDDHEYVDLGLPSGTLWATTNVGATRPEEYGDYFAWGETEPKEIYDYSTYKWCKGSSSTITKYCSNSSNGTVDNKTELELEDDAAYVNWGERWRMPSQAQIKELIDKCTWTWTTRNGVYGQLVTGPNRNTLFLPPAGDRWSDYLSSDGTNGFYWSRTLSTSVPYSCFCLSFRSDNVDQVNNFGRGRGHTVRAVRVW